MAQKSCYSPGSEKTALRCDTRANTSNTCMRSACSVFHKLQRGGGGGEGKEGWRREGEVEKGRRDGEGNEGRWRREGEVEKGRGGGEGKGRWRREGRREGEMVKGRGNGEGKGKWRREGEVEKGGGEGRGRREGEVEKGGEAETRREVEEGRGNGEGKEEERIDKAAFNMLEKYTVYRFGYFLTCVCVCGNC